MACFRPVPAYQVSSGEIRFGVERGNVLRVLSLPCGYCIGCRLARSRAWAIRCMHEAQMHEENCFITLTYSDAHYAPSLNYDDYQVFMRRLRKVVYPQKVRFFMCGEYGEKKQRAHFHALLFGVTFRDLRPFGKNLFTSKVLDGVWQEKGYASVGTCTYESAGYVARYSLKKVYGPKAAEHYKRVHIQTGEIVSIEPEFCQMSLKPGIGYSWFQKYWRDVYAARDGVVLDGGFTVPSPRYYDNLLMALNSDLREYKDYERYVNSARFVNDCTPQRLRDREVVAEARVSNNVRSLE